MVGALCWQVARSTDGAMASVLLTAATAAVAVVYLQSYYARQR